MALGETPLGIDFHAGWSLAGTLGALVLLKIVATGGIGLGRPSRRHLHADAVRRCRDGAPRRRRISRTRTGRPRAPRRTGRSSAWRAPSRRRCTLRSSRPSCSSNSATTIIGSPRCSR
jgi:hypothetical protein